MDDAATQVEAPGGAEVAIGGTVEPGFEGVRDAFAANFTEHGEVGAGFSLVVDGRTVVDLWGGVADAATGAPYTEDTLQLVFSSTKGATALCANLLAQRGELDVDAPVATYWPEFAQAGKGDIPVRWLLCHKAGLPYIDAPLELDDLLAWDPAVEALAAMTPAVGARHRPRLPRRHLRLARRRGRAPHHRQEPGHVLRRRGGRAARPRVLDRPARRAAGPRRPADQPGSAPRTARTAERPPRPTPSPAGSREPAWSSPRSRSGDLVAMVEKLLGPDSMLVKALGGAASTAVRRRGRVQPPRRAGGRAAGGQRRHQRPRPGPHVRRHDRPGRGVPTPVRCSPPSRSPRRRPRRPAAPTRCLFFETTFGLGYMTSSPFSPYGSARSFGHAGAGGSVGFADPENGLGFGYVMNRMLANLSGDPRSRGLVAAVYDAIGVTPTFA